MSNRPDWTDDRTDKPKHSPRKNQKEEQREQPAADAGSDIMPDKFKNGEQLLKAYESLEGEFTRKSQQLKELLEENERLKGELEERSAEGTDIMREFSACPEGEQYAPKLAVLIQEQPEITPAGLLSALVHIISEEKSQQERLSEDQSQDSPAERLIKDWDFIEKHVLTNEDITEHILKRYLGGLVRGQTPRSIGEGGGFIPACERRRASSIEEAGRMAAQSLSN